MKDIDFGKRLKILREAVKLTQEQAAPMIGIAYSTLQNNEAGQRPNQNNLQKYINFYRCTKVYIEAGVEPKYQKDAIGISQEKTETPAIYITAPGVEYNGDMDDFGKAASGLKEIFDSGDPVLIPAIQANIHAFQISVRREAHIQKQIKEIDNLKKRMEALEKHIKEGDRRKSQRRREDLGPPDGVERRSGLERRRFATGG